jgi:hypothetical protein
MVNGMTLPIMAFTRSSLYEHDGKQDIAQFFGIGDARFALIAGCSILKLHTKEIFNLV